MKPFGERNPVAIGLIGIGVTFLLIALALNYNRLPFSTTGRSYSAYFDGAGGLAPGNPVQVSGARVGRVSSVDLDGARVLVRFKVNGDVVLGDRTEAAVKTKSLLGAKLLELTPRGTDPLTEPIPVDRTTPAYHLPDALGDLSTTVRGLDTDQLSEALTVLAQEFAETPADIRMAVKGLTRLSQTLNDRDAQLRNLLRNANKVSTVIADRSDAVVNLVLNTNSLLGQLVTESQALDAIAGNLSAAAKQLKAFISDNRETLRPALDKLNGVLQIIDNRKEQIQESIPLLNKYVMSLGESLAAGPFFVAYISNLLPGQFVQPFIDAAFADLGLDPATKLPSELTDPQDGQAGTPPLPVPFPRTGQGGEPRQNIPEAISGNPGDRECGPPGLALPGPGCYPLREDPPAPSPGGPPPGPPAPIDEGLAQSDDSTTESAGPAPNDGEN
ncbi:MCE family protein [Mycobacterium sp. 1274756.6]|uniref:MCE family protein n=1 Tax=Mycobacterium sp. 1274756.6 TaxID=1834076 RepID=UPI000801EAF1|nr:MCE family protein [Mycobacterium sp. 1274756.6]OBJ68085.1 mammalian cell entry protein [Mycobacterium sp. 1274756.6]